MEQPLASLNLERNKLKELKLLGYEYVPKSNSLENFEECGNVVKAPKTVTAVDLYKNFSKNGTIYTFIRGVDNVLQDEIVSGNIIELCGEAGSGKTQICFQLCVNVQLPTIFGGKNSESLYICSNYNFSKRRIEEIAMKTIRKLTNVKLELTSDEILSKITHIQIEKYHELIAVIIQLKTLVKTKKIGLIVIDCISVFAQQIEYNHRKCVLYTLFSDLQQLADKHDFVIVVTNNVTLRNKTKTEIGKTPALGENFYHRVNSRIELKRVSKNYYKAILVKSVCNNKKEGYFNF